MLSPTSTERFALVVLVPQIDGNYGEDKSKQFCDYCNRPYHSRATCWSLHGPPPSGFGGRSEQYRGRGGDFRRRRGGRSHAHHSEVVDPSIVDVFNPPSSAALSSTELETFRCLMTRLDTPTTDSSSFTHSGTLATSVNAFHSSTLP